MVVKQKNSVHVENEKVTADDTTIYIVKDQATDKSIENENEVVQTIFACKSCDFVSSWENGLGMHVSNVHKDAIAKSKDAYRKTENYWKRSKLSSSYQSYLLVVEECSLSESEKEYEYEKILAARKLALGKCHKDDPP